MADSGHARGRRGGAARSTSLQNHPQTVKQLLCARANSQLCLQRTQGSPRPVSASPPHAPDQLFQHGEVRVQRLRLVLLKVVGHNAVLAKRHCRVAALLGERGSTHASCPVGVHRLTMRCWWGRRVGQQSGAWQQEEEHTWMSSGHAPLGYDKQTAPHTQPCLAAESPPVPSCGFSRPISSRSSVLLPAPGRNGASVLRSLSVTSGRMQQAAAACATACTRRGCRRSSGPAAFRQHQAVEHATHQWFQRWTRARHARSPGLHRHLAQVLHRRQPRPTGENLKGLAAAAQTEGACSAVETQRTPSDQGRTGGGSQRHGVGRPRPLQQAA